MKLFKSLALAALITAPVAAQAATAIYESGGDAFVAQYDVDWFGGDFYDDNLDDLDISVTGELEGASLTATLMVSDSTGTLLSSDTVVGSVWDIVDPDPAATLDRLTLTFGNLTGSAAALFGTTANVVFSFFEEDGDNGYFPGVTAQVFAGTTTPVPLPATLPLLAFAVAGSLAMGSRRKR
ncbi:hypothetical protein [Pseudooceanicola nitratireducens]|uniref:hypothetical protein n=1 Tax=Pseudooceanicola nitratireducens TaxID=517719 RepID=UPI003C79E3F9